MSDAVDPRSADHGARSAPAGPIGAHAGRVLGGRYELEHRIAAGGMAEVWQALDTVLGRQVAVKLLHTHLADDELLVQRFRSEAVAAARLHHPSIVAIYDTISDDGTEAIVMELIRGRTLRTFLDDRTTLTDDDAVDIGADVADALHAAHCAGVVHRDVKPANILLCDDDRVMVTDFGIAKVYDDTDLTQTGIMLGSVKYLSPEQVESSPVDGRSDVFSLGIVLYEGLTGRPPFTGDSAASMALARLHTNPPSPRQVRPAVSPALDAVVMRCLRRDPAERYTTAAELRAALLATKVHALAAAPRAADPDLTSMVDRTEIGVAPGIGAPVDGAPGLGPMVGAGRDQTEGPALRHRRRRWPLVLLLVVVAGSLGVAGALIWRASQGDDVRDLVRDNTGLELPGGSEVAAAKVTQAKSFDPLGDDGAEHDDTAANVFDGKPATTWTTDGYLTRNVGGKAGVGIWVKLDRRGPIDQVKAVTTVQGWTGQIHIADAPGADLAAWGDAVAKKADASGSVTFDAGGKEGQYVLLWITDFGPEETRGIPAYPFAFELGELEVVTG